MTPRGVAERDWLNAELAKDGLVLGDKLGAGVSSTCYTLKDHPMLVAKVTQDVGEMNMVDRMMRCTTALPGIVNIFSARRIGTGPSGKREKMLEYSERLTHLTQDQQNMFAEGIGYRDPLIPNYADQLTKLGVSPWKAMAFNLYQIRHDLKILGCTSLDDFHHQNVMVRKGYGTVISDLGFSRLSPITSARGYAR